MVQVTVVGSRQLQGAEANIIQSLVVNAESLIRVFNQLVDRKGGVVGLDNCVRNLNLERKKVGLKTSHVSVQHFFATRALSNSDTAQPRGVTWAIAPNQD